MLKRRYQSAPTFEEYVEGAKANRDLWVAIRKRAVVPEEILARVSALPGHWHLLVLSEDWCGDAVNTVPVVAALAEAAPNLELRILARDENPDLMDAHLSNGARAIPVVILLDERFVEAGWWGSRPKELQAWVMSEGKQLPPDERYRRIRSWYARDRGETTLAEIAALLEVAGKRSEAVA